MNGCSVAPSLFVIENIRRTKEIISSVIYTRIVGQTFECVLLYYKIYECKDELGKARFRGRAINGNGEI